MVVLLTDTFVFMYVMTRSVAPIAQVRCCMMNYEVERMWKETVVA